MSAQTDARAELSPPKPRLILRVGVTGHRPNNFSDAARARVVASLAAIFAQIDRRLPELHKRERGFFNAMPPEVRAVSALAEGADRAFAHAALAAGFALDVVLPFPPNVYEADFASAESRAEFRALLGKARAIFVLPGENSSKDADKVNRAYESVGLMTLRQCDLLVAIWDGTGSSGRGGTEQIVQRAILSHIPVLRFDAEGAGPYLLVADQQEPSDAIDLAINAAAAGVAGNGDIWSIVDELVSPPGKKSGASRAGDHLQENARHLLARFLGEHERRWLVVAFAYPLLLAAFDRNRHFWSSLRLKSYLAKTTAEWENYWTHLPPACFPAASRIRDIVMTRFAWTDNLANYYGQRHRSSYVANFLLSAFAVVCGAVALLAYHSGRRIFGTDIDAFSPYLAVVEFLTIAAIVISTMIARSNQWHQRWLDYRQLSEQLRHLRALVLTGSSAGELPLLHADDAFQPGPNWANWYYRATCREIGLPTVTIDEAYVRAARLAIGHAEIGDQAKYHRDNATASRRLANSLKFFGECSFFATAAICVAELPLPFFHTLDGPLFHDIFGFFSISLPAVGATAFGIGVQGDFEGSAERSLDMARRLQRIHSRLCGERPLSFAELSSLTEEAAATMASELGDFSFIYRSRPLTLPA